MPWTKRHVLAPDKLSGTLQFWLPFVSAPQPLVPSSCEAARLWARVRFHGGDRLTLSPEECAARQRAYERQRAEWRLLVEAENRHASASPWEGHTAVFDFKALP